MFISNRHRTKVLLRWRIDGVLQPLGTLPVELGPNVVARLKVLSGLLTYDTAHPQEGRIRSQDSAQPDSDHEFRVSSFPALFGENVVIRVLAGHAGSLQRIADLGLDEQVQQRLGQQLQATSGAIIITGQLVVTTFHAGSCAEAVHRLIDMGLSSYAIRNAVRLTVSQRLLRRLCKCAKPGEPATDALPLGIALPPGIKVAKCRVPSGCEACRQTGYHGRSLIAETLSLDEAEIQAALSESSSVADIEALAKRAGQGDLRDCARRLIEAGITSPAEVGRVLGVF